MFRFFIDSEDCIGEEYIQIPSKDYNHIVNVARIKPTEAFELVYKNRIYKVKLDDENADRAVIESFYTGENEAETKIRLFFGILKGSKIDFVFQKCTEIGVYEFFPVEMDRSIVKTQGKEKNKVDRWQKIVEEAAKQSKRDFVPNVNTILDSNEMIELLKGQSSIIIPYELEGKTSLKEVLKNNDDDIINLIIGPEGGFSEREIAELTAIGGMTITLGKRILRGETASVVTAANIIYEKS